MFNSLEQLKESYPIGKVLLYLTPDPRKEAYYNQTDLDVYRRENEKIELLSENEVMVYPKRFPAYVVEGYIFDSEYWYPAYRNWDGWQIWDTEEDS